MAAKAESAAPVKAVTYMVADDRETAVIPFLDDEFQAYAHLVKRIEVADYIVMRKVSTRKDPIVVAAFERKTYDDFASGFKDGRYENLAKLLALRMSTGCQLYFIIEGPAFPSPSRKFGRVPFSSIDAAITKMMVRHGVMVVHTEDQMQTAKCLAKYVAALDVEVPYVYPCAPPGSASAGGDEKEGHVGLADTENLMTVPASITTRVEESELDQAVKMWARLKGISVVLGRILADRFSVVDLAIGRVPKLTIEALKTATGRPIHRDARKNLLGLRDGEEGAAVKVLSGVRGISPAIAAVMIKAAGGVRRLLSYSASTMALIAIPQKNRVSKLGLPRATRVLSILSYKRIAGPASPTASASRSAASSAVATPELPGEGDPEQGGDPAANPPAPEVSISDAVMDELFGL